MINILVAYRSLKQRHLHTLKHSPQESVNVIVAQHSVSSSEESLSEVLVPFKVGNPEEQITIHTHIHTYIYNFNIMNIFILRNYACHKTARS